MAVHAGFNFHHYATDNEKKVITQLIQLLVVINFQLLDIVALTLILRILSVNLELKLNTSLEEIVLVLSSLLRILYFAQEREWSNLITSSSVKFICVIISE
jgi:hypothetical protein